MVETLLENEINRVECGRRRDKDGDGGSRECVLVDYSIPVAKTVWNGVC